MKRHRSVVMESLEQEWQCPIRFETMNDPVITKDGHSYERKDIELWLLKNKTSPKTGLELESVELIPNITLKNVINKFQKEMKYDLERVIIENSELAVRMQKYEQAVRQMIKERNKLQNEAKQTSQKYIDMYKKQIQTLRQQNEALKAQLSQHKQQAVRIKDENKKLESKLQIRNLQIYRINRELQQLKVQNKKLKDQGQTASKHFQLITKLKNAFDTTRNQNESLKKQITELKINNQNLAKLQSQNNKLMGQLRASEQSIKQAYIIMNTLNKDLNEKKTNQFSLKHQLSVKQNNLNQLKIQKNYLEAEIKQLRSQVEKLKNQFKGVKKNDFFPDIQITKTKPQPVIKNSIDEFIKLQQPHSHIPFNQLVENKRINKTFAQKSSSNKLGNKLAQTQNKLQNIIRTQKQVFKNIEKTSNQLNLKSQSVLKPVPLTDRSANDQSNSSSNLFKSLIKQEPKRQTILKYTFNFRQYLMENPVLYEEQSQTLDHSDHKINVQEFLKYNWSNIKILKLNGSQLDDYGFYLLVNEGSSFPNLQTLILHNNQIKNIPTRSLQRFKNLKGIYFSQKGKFANPLNQQSKMYLSDFSVKNQHINVCYKSQDSECSIQ